MFACVYFARVDCRVIEKPVNIVAVAGTTVNFNCASNQTGVIRWIFYALVSKERTQIWNGHSVLSPYLVNETQCKHEKNCNLTVTNVTLKSAGSYACRDAMLSADEFLATLTVLGEESSFYCLLNLKLTTAFCYHLMERGRIWIA
jgi:hypothetical protein